MRIIIENAPGQMVTKLRPVVGGCRTGDDLSAGYVT